MKTILLPLNLDANTLSLFEYAKPTAAKMDASLLLLHVLPKQPYDNGNFDTGTEVHQRLKQEATMILDQLSREAISHGVRTKTLVLDGNPGETIVQTAKKMRVDMILIGQACGNTHCTSEKILAAAPCPVLTCR